MSAKVLIHVNQHRIRRNIRACPSEREAVFTVKQGRTNRYANSVALVAGGATVATLVYQPDKPLSCGARVWLEVGSGVEVVLDR